MFEPTLVGSFSRMVNFLRISWSILSPSVVNFYAHLVNSRCRLHPINEIYLTTDLLASILICRAFIAIVDCD